MNEQLLKIAQKHVNGLQSFSKNNSDKLDFFDVAIWEIEAMLEEAYSAGHQDAVHEARYEF